MRKYTSILIGLFLTLVTFVGFVCMIGAQAHAQTGVSPVVVYLSTHHLGDQTIDFFDVPAPEGTVYTVDFSLPAHAVQDAFLRLETYNVEVANSVQVNGVEIGSLPGSWWLGWQPVALACLDERRSKNRHPGRRPAQRGTTDAGICGPPPAGRSAIG